jgi:hypothetical protein
VTLDELRGRAVCTIPDVAPLLDMKRSAAYDAAKRGEIPTIWIGRRRLVAVPAFLKMLGAQSETPAGEGPGLEVLDGGRHRGGDPDSG